MSSYSKKYSETLCEQLTHDGTPCKCFALRDEKYCHYHKVAGPPKIDISNPVDLNPVYFDLPLLDDATSIQSAITQVCERLLQKRIESKRAGILLYALQVAASNLGRLSDDRNHQEDSRNGSEIGLPPGSPPVLESAITPSGPDRLPPGTIQASQQRRSYRSLKRTSRNPKACV